MKSVTIFILGAISFCLPFFSLGQTYNMPAGETVTCSGTFYDPGGSAGNYPDAAPTSYVSIITAESGDQLRLLFNSIGLEGNDKLYVYDGNSTSAPLVASFDNTSLFGKPLKSTNGSSLTFEFVTDGNGIGASGWSIGISCITQPDEVNVLDDVTPNVTIACGGRTDFYDPGGFYTNYPTASKTYTTTYTSAAGQKMMFYFNSFFTAVNDVLKIYDGNSTAAPLIGTYQGFLSPFNFTSTGSSVTFEFTVNSDAFSGTGWEVMATCMNTVNIPCGAASTYYDPGGAGKRYISSYAGEDFITTYTADPGQYIEATINNFYVNGNFTQTILKVYDGSSIASPLIATFSIFNFPSTFSLSSSGNSLTFQLETSYPSGCVANYDLVLSCTSARQGTFYTIGGSASPALIPCGVTSKVYTLGGTSAYPETWQVPGPYIQTFTAPAGQYIHLECERMYTQIGDFINIYDGPNTNSPLIASYGSLNNATGRTALTFNSSSNSLTIELKTDGSAGLGGQGIIADITCVSETGPNNYSLGNSPATVNVSCSNGSTFEDNYGISPYFDNAVQNYVTTYSELTGNPLYFVFSSFYLAAGDTLYAYEGTSTSDPLLGKYSGNLPLFSVGSPGGTVTFKFVSNGVNNIAPGWYADISCNDPLPVEFTSFSARPMDGYVKLEWSTASESSNNYFIAEKSENGVDFIPFDTISGAGNSFIHLGYSCIDYNPFTGTSYYRIKQVDHDGSYSFSSVEKTVVSGEQGSFLVFPVPTEDVLNIAVSEMENRIVAIQLLDHPGKILLEKTESISSHHTLSLDLSGFSPGIYILEISDDLTKSTYKILKK